MESVDARIAATARGTGIADGNGVLRCHPGLPGSFLSEDGVSESGDLW